MHMSIHSVVIQHTQFPQEIKLSLQNVVIANLALLQLESLTCSLRNTVHCLGSAWHEQLNRQMK